MRNVGDGPLVIEGTASTPPRRDADGPADRRRRRATGSPASGGALRDVAGPRPLAPGASTATSCARREPTPWSRTTRRGSAWATDTAWHPRGARSRCPAGYTGHCGPGTRTSLMWWRAFRSGTATATPPTSSASISPSMACPTADTCSCTEVNADHSLHELTYANNASSLLLDLRWRGGEPHVRILASCPDTDRCDRQVRVRPLPPGSRCPGTSRSCRTAARWSPSGRAACDCWRRAPAAGPAARPSAAARRGRPARPRRRPGVPDQPPRLPVLHRAPLHAPERWRWTGRGWSASTAPRASAPATSTTPGGSRSGLTAGSTWHRRRGTSGLGPGSRLAQRQAPGAHPGSTAGRRRAAPPSSPSACATRRASTGSPAPGCMVANDHGPRGFDGPEGYDEVNADRPRRQLRLAGRDRRRHRRRAVPAPRPGSTSSRSRRPARPSSPARPWQGSYVLAALRGGAAAAGLRGGRVVGRPTPPDRRVRAPAQRHRGARRQPVRADQQPRRTRAPRRQGTTASSASNYRAM